MTNMIHIAVFQWSRYNSVILREIQVKLAHFKDKLRRLEEDKQYLSLRYGR